MVRRSRAGALWLSLIAGLASATGAVAAEPGASEVKARGVVAGAEGPLTVELLIDRRSHATLRLLRGDARAPEAPPRELKRSPLPTSAEVIPLLADQRLSFLWPALTEWAGPSLERLRRQMLEESELAFQRNRTVFGHALAGSLSGKAAAYAERAVLLSRAGQLEAAIAVLKQAVDRWLSEKGWGRTEQSILVAILSGRLAEAGRTDDALRLLRSAEEQVGPGSPMLNLIVNRASLLARSGRYAEALEVIDPGAQRYAAYKKTIGGWISAAPGGERYFAASKACALTGMGRAAEAKDALAPALAPTEPHSLLWDIAETNSEVRIRAYLCMHDSQALAAEMAVNVAATPVAPAAVVLMQPAAQALPEEARTLDEVRRDPRALAAVRDVMRPLPAELAPALNGWRE